jgi:hypothetical protein
VSGVAGAWRRTASIGAAGAVLLLLVANFMHLGAAPWGYDELVYARAGAAYIHGSFVQNPQHPLLVKLLFGVAERIGGANPLSVRIVSALAATLIGIGLGLVAARRWGWFAAAVAVLLWAAPLHSPLPVSRIAILEPVTTLLVGASLVCGWRWWCSRRLIWAASAGSLAGLAAGAKLTGLCALGTLIVFSLIFDRGRRVLQHLAVAAVTAGAGFALSYLPARTHAVAMVKTMLRFQLHHAAVGHPIYVAGRFYQHAPWWTMTDYLGTADGWLALAVLVALSGAALLLSSGRERQLATILAVAAAFPLVALSLSPVQLPHYVYIVTPWLLLLAVAGAVQMWRRRDALRVRGLKLIPAMLALGAIPLVVSGISGVRSDVARTPRTYAALPSLLDAYNLSPQHQVAVWGDRVVAAAYLGNSATGTPCTTHGCTVAAIVIDKSVANRYPDPAIQSLLASGRFRCRVEAGLTICLPSAGD